MEIEDFIQGEYYHISERRCWGIFRYKEPQTGYNGIDKERVDNYEGIFNFNSVNNPEFCLGSRAGCYFPGRNPRPATQKEIFWLKECVRLNQFMPLNKIKYIEEPNYEIY